MYCMASGSAGSSLSGMVGEDESADAVAMGWTLWDDGPVATGGRSRRPPVPCRVDARVMNSSPDVCTA